MALFKCKVNSNYGKAGEIVDLTGVKHEELSDRQSQLLVAHVEKEVKKVEKTKK